jgi:hypothetical protein
VGLLLCCLLPACERGVNPPTDEEWAFETWDQGLVALSGRDTLFTLSAKKWPGDAPGAISITYDAPWGTHADHHLATDAVIERGMRMDLEVVSVTYTDFPRHAHLPAIYREQLMPQGIEFFGHGHTHALHDTMEYDAAFQSFKTNFDWMTEWGLRPRCYAYPGSSGRRASTQAANAAAGFICARGDHLDPQDAVMLAGSDLEPENWHFLRSAVMGNASYLYVDRHDKLVPILDRTVDVGGWLILMYHAIGIPEGWSYYPLADFEQDLEAILERGLWSANMADAASYVKERANLDSVV